MTKRERGIVKSVTWVKKLGDNLDMCKIVIDFDELVIFYDYQDLIPFDGKEVLYTTRPDIVEGMPATVVCELVLLSTVQVVPTVENIKLCPINDTRSTCNFDFKDVQFGQFYPNSIFIVVEWKEGKSTKSKWVDFVCLDKHSKRFNLKMFNPALQEGATLSVLDDLIGKYVMADITSTKYGLQTKAVESLITGLEATPSVAIAKEYVQRVINADIGLTELNEKHNLVQFLESTIDCEPGFALVRIATLLKFIDTVDNCTVGLAIDSMKRAAICEQLYRLPSKYEYSDEVKNIMFVSRIRTLMADELITALLDERLESDDQTVRAYRTIKSMVHEIIELKFQV